MKEINEIEKKVFHHYICQQCKKEFKLSVEKYGWDLNLLFIKEISPICETCLEKNSQINLRQEVKK